MSELNNLTNDSKSDYEKGFEDGKRYFVDKLNNYKPERAKMTTIDDMLRDQFAMAAMQGTLASDINDEYSSLGGIAKRAYDMAEAMLAERAKRG